LPKSALNLCAGIDAFFTDDPALGRRAVDGDAVAQGGVP